MRFENKVAIVTGAASGIGLATALRLGSEGARIVIADLDEAECDRAAAQVKAAGAPDAWGQRVRRFAGSAGHRHGARRSRAVRTP